MVTLVQWIATGLRPRDDKSGIFTMMGMKKIEVFKHVIARREWSEGRGNPSCLEIYCLKVRYVYYVTVDRHGLRPRDDKSG
jgi:hypothetical protein